MSANGDFLRTITRSVVEAETEYACSRALAGRSLEERQIRITEAELAHRVRSAFADLDTFLNAQGKAADRDIVSDSRKVEIEIKYFRGPQGGDIPLSDWRWLVGTEQRSPVRDYERLNLSFFPRGRQGVGVQKQRGVDAPGEWLFQRCLSFTATDRSAFRPYWPIVDLVVPRSVVDGRELEPKLSFLERVHAAAIIRWNEAERWFHVMSDVIGDPLRSTVWALVHEVIDEGTAAELLTQSYTLLE